LFFVPNTIPNNHIGFRVSPTKKGPVARALCSHEIIDGGLPPLVLHASRMQDSFQQGHDIFDLPQNDLGTLGKEVLAPLTTEATPVLSNADVQAQAVVLAQD
jgi:hypothetical protein